MSTARGKKATGNKKLEMNTSGKRKSSPSDKRVGLPTAGLRNVLFKPSRSAYVRRKVDHSDRVFCAASKSVESKGPSLESLCVYHDANSLIILNKFPYNSGHLLVLPKRHAKDFSGLLENEYHGLMLTLKKAVVALETVYQPQGVNVGLNLGAAAGAGIPDHLHFHVIPRWAGDLNFFPLVSQTKVVIEDLEEVFAKLKNYFSEQKKK